MICSGMSDWDKGALSCLSDTSERRRLATYLHVFGTCELDLEIITRLFSKGSPGRR
jgi:hypothetical protein